MTWLERQVRAVALRQLLLAALVVAAFATWCGANWHYLDNYIHGPKTLSTAEVAATTSLQAVEGEWIKVKPDKIIDTGVDYITTTRRRRGGESRSVTAHYYAAQFGERLMFIKAETGDEPKGEVEGSFVKVPGDLFGAATGNKGTADLKNRFLPVMLDTSDYRQYGNWGLIIGGLCSLGALYLGVRALSQRGTPAKHPSLLALAAAPGAPSLADASTQIEADMASGTTFKSKGHVLTSGYHAKTSGFSFDANSLGDLLWAFHRVTTNKVYGFIPVGRSHAILLHFTNTPKPIEVKVSKANAENGLRFLAGHAPWAVVGFDDGVAEMFKKQRLQFIEAIQARKANVTSAPAQAGPPSA